MADQMQRIKSKRLVFQLKPPHFCFKTLAMGLCMLAAIICSVLAATCPALVPSSAATITEQSSFLTYTNPEAFGVVGSPVSNSLYYLYKIYFISSNAAIIRKVDASGSQTWITSFEFNSIWKSLSVDAAEQSVYLVSLINPLFVLRLAASDGSIVSQHQL